MSGDGARIAYPLFQTGDGGSKPTSPLQMQIIEIPVAKAVELNMAWHSRLPKYETGMCLKARVCFAAIYEGTYYGVAIWDNPSARLLPQDKWLELKRLAICSEAPKFLSSRMLKVMAILISRKFNGIEKLISYQDVEAHKGTIYKAAGWIPNHYHAGGSWYRPNSRNQKTGTPRKRPDLNRATGPKIRWEKDL
jgi:hypothetical protein